MSTQKPVLSPSSQLEQSENPNSPSPEEDLPPPPPPPPQFSSSSDDSLPPPPDDSSSFEASSLPPSATEPLPSDISISLGDIIQIIAPTNSSINDQIYLIIYADQSKLKLINASTATSLVLTIGPNGGFTDESITSIYILDQPQFPGYAKQNDLTIGKWINISFGGDLPTIITGQITDLEEDMIEVKTYPGDQIFYLDFGYKGIPENIPITHIEIRSPPSKVEEAGLSDATAAVSTKDAKFNAQLMQSVDEDAAQGIEPISISKSKAVAGSATEDIASKVPVEEMKSMLQDILIDADSIKFGDELAPIVQVVELPEEQKRYSIEKQTSDLLNELVSEVPNEKRTKVVLNNIHSLIERFCQLRDEFSIFDANGNAAPRPYNTEHYKPLAKSLMALNQKLFWIMPIVKNVRKFYNVDSVSVGDQNDFTLSTIDESIDTFNTIEQDYSSSKETFKAYMSKISDYITPFQNTDGPIIQSVRTNLSAVLDNLGNFYSSIVKRDSIKRSRFIIQTYNLGLSNIHIKKSKSFGKRNYDVVETVPLTQPDELNIQSFITLPEPAIVFSNISLPETSIISRANMNNNFIQYWNLLRKNTSITQKTIELEERETHNQYSESEMVQFTSSFMTFISSQDLDSREKYNKFIQMFVPTTDLLFDIMNKYVTGDITLTNYVAVLQPFMVYVRDLDTKQYNLIVSMIEQKILDYKSKLIQSSKEYAILSSKKYVSKCAAASVLYNLLMDSKQVKYDADILGIYGLSPENFKGAEAGGGGGGGGGVRNAPQSEKPVTFSSAADLDFEAALDNFTTTPQERAIAKSAKYIETANKMPIDTESVADLTNVYNYMKRKYPDDFEKINKQYPEKAYLVKTNVIAPVIVTMKRYMEESRREKMNERHGTSPASSSVGFGANNVFPNVMLSNEEILYRLICVDNARLYMNTLAVINEDLITPFDFDQLYAQETDKFDDKMKAGHEKNTCKNFVLTKKYTDKSDLQEEEGDEVYYDKLYDFTDYSFLKKHEKEQAEYNAADFETFLVSRYMKKTKLPITDARSEIRDMMRGRRAVQDGQYAVLMIEDEESGSGGAFGGQGAEAGEAAHDGVRYEYYIRDKGKWVKDDTIASSVSMYDTSYFCNVKDDCFSINKKCLNPELAADTLKDQIVKQMYDEFDSRIHETQKIIIDNVYRKYKYSIDTLAQLRSVKKYNIYKYNDFQYLTGVDIDRTGNQPFSPYARIFDLILGQTDYVKRQKNIMRFIQRFTRKAIDVSSQMPHSIEIESPYWLYCKDTNTKLVPSFFEMIASTFLNQGDVQVAIDTICKDRGSISEDGEAWTDKHSGYVIKNIDLDTEEGYDAAGYKLQTRDVIESSLSESLIQSIQERKIPTFKNPDSQMISNVVTTMTKYMGIDLEARRVFIVENSTRFILSSSFPTEASYNAGAKKTKSYNEYKLLTILMVTLSYLAVTIQTSIPHIKTRKTFPGCLRSFVGYPLDGEGDYSLLKYISCIAIKISSGIEPWNTIQKIKKEQTLVDQMKGFMDKFVITNATIKTKLEEKREYNKLYAVEELPAEHDIKRWINFLPPLSRIKVTTPESLSPNFTRTLQEELSKGQKTQYDKISAIRSKIIHYSFAIQIMIQDIVSKENLILTNGANAPVVENACCNPEGSINTVRYFVDRDVNVSNYNNMVKNLCDIMHDIISLQKSVSLLDPTNTRTKYPEIPEAFDETTVYLAFITYCKFNNDTLSIPENIQHLCHQKPSERIYNPAEESLRNKIDKLKSTGEYNYTNEALEALLQIVNRENIVPFNFEMKNVSYIQQLRDLIASWEEHKTPENIEIPEPMVVRLKAVMDTFDIEITEDTEELRDLKNYLADKNAEIAGVVVNFINDNKRISAKVQQRYKSFLLNVTSFKPVGDGIMCPRKDTATYKGMGYVVTQIRNLVDVFPNIIMNNIDYKKIALSKHWGLSTVHVKDIQAIVKRYYSRIDKFFKDKDSILNDLLEQVKNTMGKWLIFASHTPLLARVIEFIDIQDNDEEILMLEGEQDISEFFETVDVSGKSRSKQRKRSEEEMQRERRAFTQREATAAAAAAARGREREERVKVSEGFYSVFNDDLIRHLFTYYLLNVILKYVTIARTPVMNVQETGLSEDVESDLMSVLQAQSEQNGVGAVSELKIMTKENVELKQTVAELLISFIDIMITDKNVINVNKRDIKEDITQSKDKEKDIITRDLREMQKDEREMENIKKNLRIGDWNVGGTKGLRFYVPETYEQEREDMEAEFHREEAKVKLDKRVTADKVTQRMRDVYATEEEETQHQAALIGAELDDDYNLQGNDDEYGGDGGDDDGEYNQRGGDADE
jgi:hypothetical protein